jgi:LPXTG-motif cell wall-anchored protein
LDDLGGEGEAYINTLDADGVALAAIQGLYRVVQKKDTRIATLETENGALRSEMAALEARVAALEGASGIDSAHSQGSQANLLPWAGILLAGLGLAWAYRRRDVVGAFSGGGR